MLKFLISLFSSPAILLGAVAFIGLVSQKGKDATDVTKGTIKQLLVS